MNPHQKKFVSQTEAVFSFLNDRGIQIPCEQELSEKEDGEMAFKKKAYYNTELLLKNYRNLLWQLDCEVDTIAAELDVPFKDIDALSFSIPDGLRSCRWPYPERFSPRLFPALSGFAAFRSARRSSIGQKYFHLNSIAPFSPLAGQPNGMRQNPHAPEAFLRHGRPRGARGFRIILSLS